MINTTGRTGTIVRPKITNNMDKWQNKLIMQDRVFWNSKEKFNKAKMSFLTSLLKVSCKYLASLQQASSKFSYSKSLPNPSESQAYI